MILICNILEIGFLIYGIVDIPWNVIETGGEIFFYSSFVIIVISLFIILRLMCLRCGNKINTTKNGEGKGCCIIDIIFDIIAVICIVIAQVFILHDMYNKDDVYDYYYDIFGISYNGERRSNNISDSKWACVYVSLTGFEIVLAIHFYFTSFLIKLISAKTNLSYLKYMEEKEENDFSNKAIKVFNNDPNNQSNQDNNPQFNFPKYDQNGNPIYAGNSKNITDNQPSLRQVKGK